MEREGREGSGHAPLPVGLLEVREEQVGKEEVAQVVDGDGELKALDREGRLGVDWEVDRGVADERVQLAARGAEVVDKLVDRLQGGEVALDVRERIAWDADLAGFDLHGAGRSRRGAVPSSSWYAGGAHTAVGGCDPEA